MRVISTEHRSLAIEQATLRSTARGLSLILTFCTGLSALVYEVTWQRYLANFLGSAAQATAIILSVFLGGLCYGYHLFGRFSQIANPRRLILVCGLAEIAIGVWALIFPFVYEAVWSASGVVDPAATFVLLWELAVSIALIGFPTVLMGGTLPLLTQGLSNDLSDARRFHARIYASNTAGAFVGCLLAGFYFLPNWGLRETIVTVGWSNVAAGLFLSALSLTLPRQAAEPEATPEEKSAPASAVPLDPRRACWIAVIAGFCSLCLQTVFIRLVGLTMGASEYAFSMVVAVFVCMLSLGSWMVAKRDSKYRNIWTNQILVVLGLMAVYFTISHWGYACYLVRLNFASMPQTFYPYHATLFLILSLVLALPVGMMGATMPRLFSCVVSTPDTLGLLVGRLYAWNTLGCVLGAMCGGYWLLYFFDLDGVYRLCMFLFVLNVMIGLSWNSLPSPALRGAAALTGVALFLAVACLPDWNKANLGTGLFRARVEYEETWNGTTAFYEAYLKTTKQKFYRDGPNTTVDVSEVPADPVSRKINEGADYIRNLKVNGKSDGETSYGDMRTMRLVAHLPLLLSTERVRRIGVVGFGLGVAAGSTTLYPEVERVDVMEISPAVLWASPLFDFANYKVTKNPKVQIILGDAYRTLAANKQKYSVVISEPSNPWVTGVERLFSKEFYEIVKNTLEPSGIYVQWIHEYSLSNRPIELVFRTFMASFPHVRTFRTDSDLILLGSMQEIGHKSVDKMFERYNHLEPVKRALAQVAVPDLASLTGLELWTRKEQFGEGEIQTLEFPKLALLAGKDFFVSLDTSMAWILETELRRLWGRAAAQNSLFSIFLPAVAPADRNLAIASYARAACDSPVLLFFRGWEKKGDPCRISLMSEAVHGRVREVDPEYPGEAVTLLRRLKSENQTPDLSEWIAAVPTSTIANAQDMFALYENFDSIFLPLSLEKLLVTAAICAKGDTRQVMECMVHLVRTLAVTGHPKQARESLTEMLPDLEKELGKERSDALQQLVAASEAAFPMPPPPTEAPSETSQEKNLGDGGVEPPTR